MFRKIFDQKRIIPYTTQILLGLTVLMTYICFNKQIYNDINWIIEIGKYIIQNGFPKNDPLTFHTDLKYVPQQWLFAVALYLLNIPLNGIFGDIALTLITVGILMVSYQTSMILSNRVRFVAILNGMLMFMILMPFMYKRPMFVSFLVLGMVIFFLEKFIDSGNKKNLVIVPILSVLLVNSHASMWVLLFLVFIPYLVENYKKPLLYITFIVSFLCGFFNPYGIDAMLYVTRSYGVSNEINKYIYEMQTPPLLSQALGFYLFLVILVTICFKIRRNAKISHILLALGTIYLGISSLRNVPISIIGSIPLLASQLKDFEPFKIEESLKEVFCIFIATLFSVTIVAGSIYSNFQKTEPNIELLLGGVIQTLNQESKFKQVRPFCQASIGGLLERNGITPFIDSRSELFLKVMNQKQDILADNYDLLEGNMYYLDFIEKYNITHVITVKSCLLDNLLQKDYRFSKSSENGYIVMYEKKK